MKNIIKFGSILSLLILTNCGSDNENLEIQNSSSKIVLSKITITYYDNPTNPQTESAQFFYDNNGLLTKQTLGNGRYSTLNYDTNGKILKIMALV